LTIDALLLN